jgi:pre-mRNA-splicing factor 38A
MKRMNKQAKYELLHMDEFIDELLHGDRVCDISLPRLQKRNVLEELNEIEPRISALDVNLDDAETSSSEDEEDESSSSQSDSQSSSSSNSRSTSRDRHKKRSSHHHDHRRRRGLVIMII